MVELKNGVVQLVKDLGAYEIRIADPSGFENAIPGCRPHDIWKHCNSVIVFGLFVGLDYYRSLQLERKTVGENRIMHIFRDWIQYKVAEFLQERRLNAVIPTGLFDQERLIHRLSLKLAAYEAGLGVYGRCSIIITPEYGPRVNLGVVLTNARLEPDQKLRKFNPCRNCQRCVNSCPPGAISEHRNPPTGYSRDRCVGFIQKLREELCNKQFLCGYCYNLCPIGKKWADKPAFQLSRYETLSDLPARERKHLIMRC